MTAPESAELVGRELLIDAIAETLDTGMGGAVVYGDVGLGKSALADALVKRFEGEMRVFLLRASAALGSIPYGALSQFIRGLEENELNSPLLVLRRLKAHFEGLRGRKGEPPVLIVDDAQDLDESSSHILEQLMMAEVVKLLLLGLERGAEHEGVFALSRDGLLAIFRLKPLDEEEVRQYCERELGGVVAAGTVYYLTAYSGGNPYLLKALISSALRQGELERHHGVWVATGRDENSDPFLTHAIKEFLQRSSPLEWTLIQTVALLEPAPMSLLPDIVHHEQLTQLLEHGVLQLDKESESVSIRYLLCAEVARRNVPVGRSRDIRLRALESAGEHLPATIGSVRWLHWLLDTGDPAHDADLLGGAVLANGHFDPKSAVRFAAAIASPQLVPAARAQTAYALLCLNEIEEATTQSGAAMASAHDPATLASAALVAARVAAHTGRSAAAVKSVADAWDHALLSLRKTAGEGATGVPSTGDLLRQYAHTLAGTYREPLRRLPEIINSRSGSTEEQGLARILLAEALDAAGRAVDAADLALDAAAHVSDDPVLAPLYPAIMFRGVVMLMHAGRSGRALQLIEEWRLSAPPRYVYFGGEGPSLQGIVEVGRGQVREGLERLAGGIEALRKRDLDVMLPYAVGHASFAAMLLGDSARARRYAADFEALPHRGSEATWLVARGYVAAGRAGLAAPDDPALTEAVSEANAAGMIGAECELLELLTLLGGSAHLDRFAEVGAMTQGSDGETLRFVANALRGEDPERMIEAAARADAQGKPLLAAECLARAARAYAGRNLARLQRAVLQRLIHHPAAFPEAREDLREVAAASLTSREREIVRLVLEGRSNQKIAEALTVSIRTVEGHLYRIFSKLGISHRQELSEEHLHS